MVSIDEFKPVYVMHVASGILKMHPQTMRKYERMGMVIPERENKMRLYSMSDINKLEHIKGLVKQGVNTAGVKIILELEGKLDAINRN